MDHGVKILSTELLRPVRAVDNPPKFSLTAFDRIMRHVPYQQRVLFYKSPTLPFEDLVLLLKTTLAQVLAIFYPFAGRIRVVAIDDSESTIPPLELDCGAGQGVKFTLAETDATLEGLGSDFQPSEFCNALCDLGSDPPTYPWSHDNPLLYIQVTRFSCGGLGLGFGFSHQAVDGVSAWQFMISWAEMARTGGLRVLPEIRYEFEEQQHVSAITTALKSAPHMWEASVEVKPDDDGEKLVTKQFKLEKEMIDSLKSEASAAANGTRFSTFVVVSSYFWRRITLARRLPHADPVSNFIFLVNCRERLKSLSKTYFGNAVIAGHASVNVTAGEGALELWQCAAALHTVVTGFSNDTALQTVAYLDWKCRSEPLGSSAEIVQAIGSPRHPVYETDFGFGKPVGVTVGVNDLGDGKLYLFPSAEGEGGVSVTVVLKEHVMEQLLKQDG